MVTKASSVAVPIKIRACISYAEFIDYSGNDGIEEAVMLLLMVLHGLNSPQVKAFGSELSIVP